MPHAKLFGDHSGKMRRTNLQNHGLRQSSPALPCDLMAGMDWWSRFVLAWELSNTLEAAFCVPA